jgi:WD40 repeat protein
MSYLEKVRQVEESKVEDWHITPPKLIDQEKFIINIKQKHQIASLIAGSLKDLQIRIPSIDQIRKEAFVPRSIAISPKNSLTASINARGTLFLGANDGQLFYEHDFTYKSIQAHDSLIRALEHDGQFHLFSGSDDYKIKMWDIRGDEPQLKRVFGSIEGIRSYHRQITLLDRGRFLASSRGQFDEYQIRLWDL